jgi:hypothetical protein
MAGKEYSHIKTEIGISPLEFDLAIVSISSAGTIGELNKFVLKELGYPEYSLESLNLKKGYDFLFTANQKSILFIVTVGDGNVKTNLQKNLRNAIESNSKRLVGQNVWVPLMGTGTGGLDFVVSYDTTAGVLKEFNNISYTIAIPNNEKGIDFLKNNKVYNLQNKEELKGNIKTESKVTGNLTAKKTSKKSITNEDPLKDLETAVKGSNASNSFDSDSNDSPNSQEQSTVLEVENSTHKTTSTLKGDLFTKQPGYDKLPEFNTHRLVRDVLDKEYELNLLIDSRSTRNGFAQILDLSDDKNKAYVQLLDKSKFIGVKPVGGFTTGDGTSETEIMVAIFDHIENQINFIQSVDTIKKNYLHFAFFSNSFSKANIEYAHKWFDKKQGFDVTVLELDDIIKLADKHGIDHADYLNEDLGDKAIPSDELKKTKDKIPFHLDQVVNEDKLGREPVAKAFVDLIKKDIFTEKLNHSFIVHLQGKWGSGKSSFLNFIKRNLNSEEEKWIIVEYNAWQNQHIRPPWWSLIDQVYLKSKEQLYLIGIRTSLHLWRKEFFRRIWRYSGWDKISALIIFLLSVLCIIYFGEDIVDIFNTDQKKSFASNLGDFLKLILTLVSVAGTLFAFAKFITVPFFINSSKEAKSFVLRASDPMNKIKDHFNDLVDDINSKKKKRQLAIFIDDIDRCDKDFIVQLLEGIQTLFKDKRVLYIVAGDKNWISTSFGNTYEDFATDQVDKQQLGEFFIEKAFQLSFRLPNISEESKQNYWDHILGMENGEKDKKINSIEELTDDKKFELRADLKESKTELTNPVFVRGLQDKYNLSGDTASNIVIEEKNKDTEELKHLLHEYHKFIDTNPRSMIRLANNYTMARSILMAERVTFNEHKLFRWLVIEDLCPKVKTIVPNAENLSVFEEIIKANMDIVKRNKCLNLLEGASDFMEGKIEIEDIKTIKGF